MSQRETGRNQKKNLFRDINEKSKSIWMYKKKCYQQLAKTIGSKLKKKCVEVEKMDF